MGARSMIIDRPDRQSRGHRIGFGLITLFFWLIWIYLWLPLITAFAWYLGFERFRHVFVELEGFDGLLEVLGTYFTILQLIVVVFLGWSLYNQHRFGGKDQRRLVRKTNYRTMCDSFGLSRHGLNRLRHAKTATVDYRIGGAVTILETQATNEVDPLGDDTASVADALIPPRPKKRPPASEASGRVEPPG